MIRHNMTKHKYIHNTQHRDGNPNKSQWIISCANEKEIWNNAPYSTNCPCYGLYVQNDKPDYLGIPAKSTLSPLKKLFIAKFRGSPNGIFFTWHGYPADTTLNTQDRPSEDYLNEWMEKKYISLAQASKILKGKKCRL